jgi:BirA family biotin operon repressor/biotin-[acetyl-CoA-carboxylase] ligase
MQESQGTTLPRMVILDDIDSTNLCAMRLIQANMAEHGLVVLAKHQTAGRGQRGKHWQSLPGQNLLFSMVIETKGWPLQQQFIWNMAVALACRELVEENVGAACKIKWPNDLFIGDKKAGGILIENVVRGEWNWTVVGVGMNILQRSFDEELLDKATSWAIEHSGKVAWDLEGLAIKLGKKLIDASDWQNRPKEICVDYNKHLYQLGEEITLKKGEFIERVRVLGVDDYGLIQIKRGEILESLVHGSSEWVIE